MCETDFYFHCSVLFWGGPICESDFYFHYFFDSVESINYTVWTQVHLFVNLRGQSGGPLAYFLSVNKKTNYYREVCTNKPFLERSLV